MPSASSAQVLKQVIARSSPLVSIDQLEQMIGAPNIKIYDVRGTWKSPARALPEVYAEGHVPGAIFLDWTKHFLDSNEKLSLAPVADQAAAEKSFSSLGITASDLVILYDDYHHMQAGRIWWAMRYWGFKNVRVLNGGWGKWFASNKLVSTDLPEIPMGDFKPKLHEDLRISLEEFVETHAAHCLIDARGPASYAGTPGDPTTGHIPGAINIPYSALLDGDSSLFLQPPALSAVFDKRAPLWRDYPIITSCGSGYAATVALLALAELGYQGRLFDGSFSVWKQDPNRLIEQST
ncbi:MAG: sulfurtransferase [Pseudomonadota bacterium]